MKRFGATDDLLLLYDVAGIRPRVRFVLDPF